MSSFAREQLEAWVKTIDVKADRVLDIGGAQYPIKGRTKSWEVKEYKILDLEKPHECEKYPDYVGDIQDARAMRDVLTKTGRFDVVFLLEVAEYLWRPWVALRNCRGFLKDGGTLYSSWHFIYPHHNPEGEDYLRYTKWGVQKLLKEAGFQIEEMVPRAEKGHLRRGRGIKMKGQSARIEAFYAREGMRPCEAFKEHHVVGWAVKAKKIIN